MSNETCKMRTSIYVHVHAKTMVMMGVCLCVCVEREGGGGGWVGVWWVYGYMGGGVVVKFQYIPYILIISCNITSC